MLALAAIIYLAGGTSAPSPSSTALLVAIVTIVPSTIAAIGTIGNKREIARVRSEVTPSGSPQEEHERPLLYRLVWETHERVTDLADRVSTLETKENR